MSALYVLLPMPLRLLTCKSGVLNSEYQVVLNLLPTSKLLQCPKSSHILLLSVVVWIHLWRNESLLDCSENHWDWWVILLISRCWEYRKRPRCQNVEINIVIQLQYSPGTDPTSIFCKNSTSFLSQNYINIMLNLLKIKSKYWWYFLAGFSFCRLST